MPSLFRAAFLSAAIVSLAACSQQNSDGLLGSDHPEKDDPPAATSKASQPPPTVNVPPPAPEPAPATSPPPKAQVPPRQPAQQRCGTIPSVVEASFNGSDPLAQLSPRDLVSADIKTLNSLDPEYECSIGKYDQAHQKVFSQVFGGVNRAAIVNYLNTRIHYYYSPEELMSFTIQPEEFRRAIDDAASAPRQNTGRAQAMVGAANIGASMWLQSVVEGVTVTLKTRDQTITVDSSRVGLMEIGPGYLADMDTQDGAIAIPPAMRIAILLHEARHSDCTGGITRNDLAALTGPTPPPSFQCGHIHVICPSGDYRGLPACDNKPWGAYSVGMIWEQATLATLSDLDRSIMEADAIDNRSRLLFDSEQMLAGAYGEPDMTSEGLKR